MCVHASYPAVGRGGGRRRGSDRRTTRSMSSHLISPHFITCAPCMLHSVHHHIWPGVKLGGMQGISVLPPLIWDFPCLIWDPPHLTSYPPRPISDSVDQIIILHGQPSPKCTIWPISNLQPSNTMQKVTVFFTVYVDLLRCFCYFFMLVLHELFGSLKMTNI